MAKSSSEIKQAVIEILIAGLESSDEDLVRFVKQLDSKKFANRSKATEFLTANFKKWQTRLQEFAVDESQSVESRMRIKSIIADAKLTNKRNFSIRDFVEKNELLLDDEYLFSLADEGDKLTTKAILGQVQSNHPELSRQEVEALYQKWKAEK